MQTQENSSSVSFHPPVLSSVSYDIGHLLSSEGIYFEMTAQKFAVQVNKLGTNFLSTCSLNIWRIPSLFCYPYSSSGCK